ncbi:unnamed protein product [Amoebophrya sp. A25]|nr:unnamed protein product [Amoebophrya sp. A25]|eukprot:GSA25T00000412001.1
MSPMGINATAIAFNVSSACHENNAILLFKMPGMCAYLKQCNDMCLLGCMPATLAIFVLLAKIGVGPFVDWCSNGFEAGTTARTSATTTKRDDGLIVTTFVLTVLQLLFVFRFGPRNEAAVPCTCCVFFGGLMQDQPVAPEDWIRDNPTLDPAVWALNKDGVEIEQYICGRAMEKMRILDEADMLSTTYTEYAKNSLKWFWRRRGWLGSSVAVSLAVPQLHRGADL